MYWFTWDCCSAVEETFERIALIPNTYSVAVSRALGGLREEGIVASKGGEEAGDIE